MQRSFTFIEIVIVLGLTAILISLATGVVPNLFSQTRLQESVAYIEDIIEKTKEQTFRTDGIGAAGIRFEEHTYTTFNGAAYDAFPETQKEITYPNYFSISSATFGSGQDLVFLRASRTVIEDGTIEITTSDSRTQILTIDSFGIIHE